MTEGENNPRSVSGDDPRNEPRTDPGRQAMVGSLRVLDERAFEEFSGRLASLIDDASASSERLGELVARTEVLSDNASSTKGQLEQRLELSARVLKITKGQLDRVESALGALNDSQEKVDEISAALRDQLTQFNANLEEAMEEVDRRVTEAADGLGSQSKASAEKAARLEQLLEAARSLGDRFAAIEGQLAGGVTRFQEGLELALEEIATGNTRAERASSKLDEQVFALKSRVVAFAEGIEQWLKPALAEMQAHRQDVERAGEEVRRQFAELGERVGRGLQDIEDRIAAGLDGLSARQGSSAQAAGQIGESLAELQSKLDEWTGSVHGQLGRLGALAGDSLRPLVEQLAAHIEATCVGEADLASRLGELQGRLESSLRRIGDDLAGQLAGAVDRAQGAEASALQVWEKDRALRERVVDGLGEIGRRLSAIDQHIAEHLGEGIQSRLGAVESRIAEGQGAMDAALEPLRRRLADAFELLALRQRSDDDGAASRSQLADGQSQLRAALERLDDRLTHALLVFEDRREGDDGRIAGHLSAVKEQVAALGARLESEVAPLLDSLRQRLRDDLESKIVAATEKLDSRVAEILAELEVRSRRVEEDTASSREQMERLVTLFQGAVDRLDKEIAGPVRKLAEKLPGQGQHLKGLKELLEVTAARLHGEVAGALAEMTRRGTKQGERVARQVSELQAKLDETVAGVDQRVTASLDALDSRAAQQDHELTARIGQLQEHLELIASRLKNRIEPTLASLQPKMGGGSSDPAGDQAGTIALLRDAMAELGGELREQVKETIGATIGGHRSAEAEVSEVIDGRLSEIRQELTDLGRRFESLPADGHAPATESAVGGLSRQLDEIEARLEQVLAYGATLSDPAAAPATETIEQELDDLRRTMAQVLERLDERAVQPPAPVGGADVERLESSIRDLVSQSEQRMLAALSALECKLDERPAPSGGAATAAREPRARRPSAPDPGKLVGALLEAVNSGDPNLVRRFVATEYAESALAGRDVEERIEVYLSLHEDAGDLELRHIEKADGTEIVALVQERGSMQWHRFQLQLEPYPPHKILLVNIDAV